VFYGMSHDCRDSINMRESFTNKKIEAEFKEAGSAKESRQRSLKRGKKEKEVGE
jgi:hypothetical protein